MLFISENVDFFWVVPFSSYTKDIVYNVYCSANGTIKHITLIIHTYYRRVVSSDGIVIFVSYCIVYMARSHSKADLIDLAS